MNSNQKQKLREIDQKINVVIIGAGFGGIACAQTLEKLRNKYKNQEIRIVLIEPKSYFEYHAALYRTVTGRSPFEVCIPLQEIFANSEIEIISDYVNDVNFKDKSVSCVSGQQILYDFLVVSVGSEVCYFNIEGIETYSFGFKSTPEALKLRYHIEQPLNRCVKLKDQQQVECNSHFVIVGAGASGVELAGELGYFIRNYTYRHKLPSGQVQIDLIEASNRVLPQLPPTVSKKVEKRLKELGVNIVLNQNVVKEDIDELKLQNSSLYTKTVIWTAGAKAHCLQESVFTPDYLTQKAKVNVNEFLQPTTQKNLSISDVFIVGDGANTKYSGMAQTALYDGGFVAQNIINILNGVSLNDYSCPQPFYSIPVGPGWAVYSKGTREVYGYFGWLIRRWTDFKVFNSILSFMGAWSVFKFGRAFVD